jgi:triphosphoribosyl-dephospho-CoA synthase
MLSTGLCAQLACIWEATARKPGNVHRHRDFADLTYLDLIQSAAAIAPVLERAPGQPIGQTILAAVQVTREVVTTNTNLGIILLLAPLAAVPAAEELRTGVSRVLSALNVGDARAAYAAIRLALPGGLGRVTAQDVRDEPTESLLEVMRLASDRDLIARQYVNGFREVFADGVPALVTGLEQLGSLEGAIVHTHLSLLARHLDSLIARKRGRSEAEETSRRARLVLEAGWPADAGWPALLELDRWLREDGRQRNPGTTADLVAACLFVALREDKIQVPIRIPWSVGFDHG